MPRVAIVHDFLMQMGGAEKVVEVLHEMFPDAPIYTSAYDRDAMPAHYRDWDVHTTFLQRLPLKRRTHRAALLLYPVAFESFDLSNFDLVISSSAWFAKGVITQPHTTHISYTYTPMRLAWMPNFYMKEERVSMMMRTLIAPALNYLRSWDVQASLRVDHHVAISEVVAARIQKFYRRDSVVIPPPVDTQRFYVSPEVDDYYIMVARLAPYKRLDLAVRALTKLKRPLKIVGTGRYMEQLKKMAGPNVEFLGRVSDAELPRLLARAKAYIMPGMEDFGIAPVEANAAGRPVIALGQGGAVDSQIDGVTGCLFSEPTVASLIEAIKRADTIEFDPALIRAHAEKFDRESFKARMGEYIARVMAPANPAGDEDSRADPCAKANMIRLLPRSPEAPAHHAAAQNSAQGNGANANGANANGANANGKPGKTGVRSSGS